MTKAVIDKYLASLKELVMGISNDLAHIDAINETLCPNPCEDEDVDTGMTIEQEEERDRLMECLRWTICVEFPHLVKEEERKKRNL